MNYLNTTVGGNSLIIPSVSKPDPFYAASFNGSNYVVMAGSPGIATQLTGDFSIFAWINTTVSTSYPIIVFAGASTSNTGVFLLINNSGQVACFLSGNPGPSSSVVVADGNWHHVGVVNSGGTFQIWVDGVGGATQSMSPSLTGNNAFIGYAPGYSSFTGEISEVVFFSRGLSSFDIGNLYNNGYGVFGNTSNQPWNDDLVAGYHLNGDFTDYSGNNRNGGSVNDVTFDTGYIIPPVIVDPLWSTVLLDTSTNSFSINLETASGNTGRVHTFKDNTGDAGLNKVFIIPQDGETIDGINSQLLTGNYGSITLQADGTNWKITNQEPSNTLYADESGSIDVVGQMIGYNLSGTTQFIPGAVAGTGATTVGSIGTDTNGIISVWTGTGSGGYGPVAKVQFATTKPYQPIIQLTAANIYATALFGTGQVFVDSQSVTNSGFYLVSAGSGYGNASGLQDSKNYQWYYNVTGTPVPPTENLTAWYTADSLAYSNNDLVSSWSDQTGNGWTMTSSDVYRPQFKTNIQNGLPAVRFTATTSSYSSYMLNNSLSLGPVCTVCVVCRPTTVCDSSNTSTGINTIFSDAHTTNVTGSIVSNNWTIYSGNPVTGSNTVLANNNYILVGVFDEASSEIVSNGVVVGTGEAGTGSTISFFVGANNTFDSPFDGYIMEILVYNNQTYPTESLTYLNNKWKIY